MIGAAERVMRDCENFIAAGDMDSAMKCAKGVSILTGQDAWEKAYGSIINGESAIKYVEWRDVDIPNHFATMLHRMHDESGQEFPTQSVRGGTQVNLTHDAEFRSWVSAIAGEPIGIWTVRLNTGGHHIPHIHPRGGNSGVVYIEVPDPQSGQLYFGVPRFIDIPMQMRIYPHPGLMVTFPNWLWHGVTEYRGTAPRLTIAFDTVVPNG